MICIIYIYIYITKIDVEHCKTCILYVIVVCNVLYIILYEKIGRSPALTLSFPGHSSRLKSSYAAASVNRAHCYKITMGQIRGWVSQITLTLFK